MNEARPSDQLTRREFLGRTTARVAATAVVGPALLSSGAQAAELARKMIGIQVGAVSFVDEGVAPVLDRFQHDAGINTLFVATFTYGRGIARRIATIPRILGKCFKRSARGRPQQQRYKHLKGLIKDRTLMHWNVTIKVKKYVNP